MDVFPRVSAATLPSCYRPFCKPLCPETFLFVLAWCEISMCALSRPPERWRSPPQVPLALIQGRCIGVVWPPRRVGANLSPP